MIFISAKKLASITNGFLYKIDSSKAKKLLFHSIITHSNQKISKSLFIALKGKKFNGHCFAKDAVKSGAIILLVDKKININCPQVIVKNTRYAMSQLAYWYRRNSNAKFLALTGSSGKTTIKEMVSLILMQSGSTICNEKNFNNDIGVSKTLFNLKKKHKYVVVEIGANHIGEIRYIVNIVKPDAVLINNLFIAHISGFGSFDNLTKSKGEIFSKLSKTGTAIINLNSHNFLNWKKYFKKDQKIWFFSFKKNKNSKFYVKNVKIGLNGSKFDLYTPKGKISIVLSLIGKHNILNAIAASALAMSIGVNKENISIGLKKILPIPGRMYPIYLSSKKIILDDTYNSNFGSMIAAVEVLSYFPKYRIFVTSDMNELGNQSKTYHEKLEKIINKMNFDKVLSIGKKTNIFFKKDKFSEHFKFKKDLTLRLISLIKDNRTVSVLIKGSRKFKMEEIVKSVMEYFLC